MPHLRQLSRAHHANLAEFLASDDFTRDGDDFDSTYKIFEDEGTLQVLA